MAFLTAQFDAARTSVSRRDACGQHFHSHLTHQRVMAAQRRLETTREPIDTIAEAVGLQTAATLRLHFRQALSTTPTAYRRRFSTQAPGSLPSGSP